MLSQGPIAAQPHAMLMYADIGPLSLKMGNNVDLQNDKIEYAQLNYCANDGQVNKACDESTTERHPAGKHTP